MKCRIKYLHDFQDYPCRKCRGFWRYWLQIIKNKLL